MNIIIVMAGSQLQTLVKIRLRKEGHFNEDTLSEYIMFMLNQNKPQTVILHELEEVLGHKQAIDFTNWLWMALEEWRSQEYDSKPSCGNYYIEQ